MPVIGYFRPMLRIILLIFLCLGCLCGQSHPFHVTLVQINHNADDQSLEITMKIFSDDLEKGMESHFGKDFMARSDKDLAVADSLIMEYVDSEFQLQIDGEKLKTDWVGKEVEMDITWCYWKVKGVENVGELTIWCPLLMNVYDDQTNIIHLFSGEAKGSALLHDDEPMRSIKLN